jgi:hypothetical protein
VSLLGRRASFDQRQWEWPLSALCSRWQQGFAAGSELAGTSGAGIARSCPIAVIARRPLIGAAGMKPRRLHSAGVHPCIALGRRLCRRTVVTFEASRVWQALR